MSALPFPESPLTDEAVTLRPWRLEDAAEKAAWGTDPVILRWTAMPANFTEEDARARTRFTEQERKAGRLLALAITDATTGAVVGSCDIRRPDPEDPNLGVCPMKCVSFG